MTDGKDIGGIVDDLVTTDIGGRQTIGPITNARGGGNAPAAPMEAAHQLREAVDPGDTVVVLTGFLIPPTMIQETDGPIGAVSVARAIDAGLDANPVISCEPDAVEVCRATATAGGLSVLDRTESLESVHTTAVEAFPSNRAAAAEYAETVVNDLDPAAVVAVEKVAPNRSGTYHNMAGYDISGPTSKVDELYNRLGSTPTVAVGDAGNEVGMGEVEGAVREEIRYGATCQCDCGDGIASAIGADVLVPAAVSNWGAHAIVTCLSDLLGRQLLHEPAVERRMLGAAADAGSIDGIAGGTTGWCDGLPVDVHEAIVTALREVTRSSVHDRGGGELGR